MQDSFLMYRSFHEALSELSMEEYGKIMYAINEYALNGEEPELSGVLKMAFTLIKPQIDANRMRRDTGIKNGMKGGRPRKNPAENTGCDSPAESETTAMEETFAENENPRVFNSETGGFENKNANENVNVNVNVNENENVNVNENSDAYTPAPAKKYAFEVFKIFRDAGLPLGDKTGTEFLMNTFKNGLGFLHSSPEFKNLHSDDVIQACRNYAAVCNAPDTWEGYRRRMNFDMFVRNRRFAEYLPQNFCADNFRDRSKKNAPDGQAQAGVTKFIQVCRSCGAKSAWFDNSVSAYRCDSCGGKFTFDEWEAMDSEQSQSY